MLKSLVESLVLSYESWYMQGFVCSLVCSLQRVRCLLTVRGTWVQSLGQEDHLEKEIAAHSSILAWRITWTEEPGGL